uniref:Uncharacterized protein n=1 Tax=Triticum urartu TaxID=4572 RepID=A0A8R7V7G6_TRIUA
MRRSSPSASAGSGSTTPPTRSPTRSSCPPPTPTSSGPSSATAPLLSSSWRATAPRLLQSEGYPTPPSSAHSPPWKGTDEAGVPPAGRSDPASHPLCCARPRSNPAPLPLPPAVLYFA